jgi:site-specific recombinase XerD
METAAAVQTRITAEVPTVAVYSRHRATCKLFGVDTKIGCDCPKQLVWYRNGKQHRQAAGTRDHEVAERKAADMMSRFAGEPVTASNGGAGIDDAITKYVESRKHDGSNITDKRVRTVKFNMECFAKFCAARGIVNLTEVKPLDVSDFRNSLTGHQNTNAKKINAVSELFEFGREFEMCEKNPVTKSCKVKKVTEEKTPRALDEKQFEQLLAAIPRVNGATTDTERDLLRAVCLLQRWSGLAIRDAVCIERAQFKPFTRDGVKFFRVEGKRRKTKKGYLAILKAEIVEQIFAGARPAGQYLFVETVPTGERDLDNMIAKWGTLFTKLGKVVELVDEKTGAPYPFSGSHALRHTFVAMCFLRDLSTEAVAHLIGDNVKTVIDSYSVMINARDAHVADKMIEMLTAK